MHDNLYDGGRVKVGDIDVDVTSILRIRMQNLKRLEEKYDRMIAKYKMTKNIGSEIDTHIIGLLNNTNNTQYILDETYLY